MRSSASETTARAMPSSVKAMPIGVRSQMYMAHGECRIISRPQFSAQHRPSKRYFGQCQIPIRRSRSFSSSHLPKKRRAGHIVVFRQGTARPSSHVFELDDEPPSFHEAPVLRPRGVDQDLRQFPEWNGSGKPSSIARSLAAPADVPGGHEGERGCRWRLPTALAQPEPLAIS